MKRIMLILLCMAAITSGCDTGSNTKEPPVIECEEPLALVLVVNDIESNVCFSWDYLFQYKKEEALEIFSDLFEVSEESMEGMSLSQIIETHGEDWQIRSICEAATLYDTCVVLTDNDATAGKFTAAVSQCYEAGYVVDALFCLHESQSKEICFADADVSTEDINAELISRGARLRSLYQTCCYAYNAFDDWTSAGAQAVCGAKEANSYVIFAPANFMKYWNKGYDFRSAVQRAFDDEEDEIKRWDRPGLVISSYMLSDSDREDSKMYFAGQRPDIKINQIPTGYFGD